MEPEREGRYKSTDQNRDVAVTSDIGAVVLVELSHAHTAEETEE